MVSHSIGTHNATYVAPLTGSKGGAKTSFTEGLDKTAQIQQSHFGTLNASMNQAGRDKDTSVNSSPARDFPRGR